MPKEPNRGKLTPKRSKSTPQQRDRHALSYRHSGEGDRTRFREYIDHAPAFPAPPSYQPAEIDIPYEEDDWHYTFLKSFAEFPNVTRACFRAHVSREWAHKQRREDPVFAELWDTCKASALDQLEQSVHERALDAWDPASAGLAKWILSNQRPDEYGSNGRVKHDHELHTRDDKPLSIQVEQIDYRNFMGAIAPPDRALIDGQRVDDIVEDDELADFREILDPTDR